MSPIRLETERLTIDPLEGSDAEALFRYRSDPEVFCYQRWAPAGEEEAREFIARHSGVPPWTPDAWSQLALRLRETGELVGDCGLRFPEEGGRDIEFGISLAPAHQRTGLGLEAVRAIFSYAFDRLGADRVVACADPRNEASVGLMERAGMTKEKLVHRGTLVRGEWTDDVYYAIDRIRWESGAPAAEGAFHGADLWAITSFFNPAGYRSRARNFRVFRERLAVPLVAVELRYGDHFELGPGDADVLIRISSRDVLWQKERLLNLAAAALPDECRFVAWVDADVVFASDDWAERTREALGRYALVQPFDRVLDLGPGILPPSTSSGAPRFERPSMASALARGAVPDEGPSTDMTGRYSPGHAWAARRALLGRVGLYDAMIAGSGDNVIAQAAVGRAPMIVDAYEMNERQGEHYLRWARRFQSEVGGEVGAVSGDLHHLWHGDLADRGYGTRYAGLAPFRFDPERDIALDPNGAWRWSSEKPEMHEYLRDYFRRRREDR